MAAESRVFRKKTAWTSLMIPPGTALTPFTANKKHNGGAYYSSDAPTPPPEAASCKLAAANARARLFLLFTSAQERINIKRRYTPLRGVNVRGILYNADGGALMFARLARDDAG